MNDGARLSARFAAALGCDGPVAPAPGALLGVEHEYELKRDGVAVDARSVLHSFSIPGLRLDPGDSNAYRLPSGAALTCDDAEIEVATPPIVVGAGAAGVAEQWAADTYATLRSLVPGGYELSGTSTHLNFAMPGAWNERAALLFARRFAPAFMLLCDRPESHGVYIRPRPGRLELCGDFLAGDGLRVVTTFALGAVRAIAAGLGGEAASLPPALAPWLFPVPERYGLYADRDASFGCPLYRDGREAMLRLAAGGLISANEHLAASWGSARGALSGVGDAEDIARLDAIVAGDAPLGIEACECWRTHRCECGDGATSVYGRVLEQYRRPGFDVTTVCSTWDVAVFRIASAGTHRYASVPAAWLPAFFESLECGRLDHVIAEYAALPANGRVLAKRVQTLVPGLFDAHGPLEGLLAPERQPGPIEWVDDRLPVSGLFPMAAVSQGPVAVEPHKANPIVAASVGSVGALTRPAPAMQAEASSPRDPARAPDPATPIRVAARPGKFAVVRTVRPDDSGVPQESGGGLPRWLTAMGGGVLLLVLITIIVFLLHTGGRGDDRPTASESPNAVVPLTSPGSAPTSANAETPTVAVSETTGGGTTNGAAPSPASVPTPTGTTATGAAATPTSAGAAASPTSGTAATPTPPPTATPTTATAPTPTTPPVVLSGNRTVGFSVLSNPADHPVDIPPTMELNFFITRDRSVDPNPVTIKVTGPGLPALNGATIIGPTFGSQGGTATASAAGTYRGFNTTYVLAFTISPDGVSGTLTIGGDGGLPTGQPLVLTFSGGPPH